MSIACEFLSLFKKVWDQNISVGPQIGLETPQRLSICPPRLKD